MSPIIILVSIAVYFFALVGISIYTSRHADNTSYFTGNKASPWLAVAFGMIGDSLSGVTFISVPGLVVLAKFSYLQLVLGYLAGYFVIAYVLMPVYYKMNLTSIYTYLETRFGAGAERTGSFFFIVSRTLGAAGRLFLAAGVLQTFVFDAFHIPFFVAVAFIIALMLVYTAKGGIKTLVWTDTFQSLFLLMGVILSIAAIASNLNLDFSGLVNTVKESPLSETFFWDFKEKNYFWKQFLGGFFIAIAMTGLDQNMMQKNLSCRSLGEAQKNIVSFSFVMVMVNVFFLSLGVLLYTFVDFNHIAIPLNAEGKMITDKLFPVLALNHLGVWAGLAFIIGLTAATFSSADSVLTTLTTSFYYDFLHLQRNEKVSEEKKTIYRNLIHIGFALLLLVCIVVFSLLNDKAIVDTILTLAGYTYGPLLGLFAFGILTKRVATDKWIPILAIIPPVVCYYFSLHSEQWLSGYKVGLELLFFNGLLMFGLLWIFSGKQVK
ncbi:MAG: sodium:solute symporter [Bacteroidia bacterium]|nr:sodium:solute symporter [Bacteroidia bacterium]